jgi:hypothetical protein
VMRSVPDNMFWKKISNAWQSIVAIYTGPAVVWIRLKTIRHPRTGRGGLRFIPAPARPGARRSGYVDRSCHDHTGPSCYIDTREVYCRTCTTPCAAAFHYDPW